MIKTSKTRRVKTHYLMDEIPLLDYCDDLFSKMIRDAAEWRCVRCGGDFRHRHHQLQTSHFFRRDIAATRFDPRNADPLCHACHLGAAGWERQKHTEYLSYMQGKLGKESFAELRRTARQRKSLDEAKAEFLAMVKAGTFWDVAY